MIKKIIKGLGYVLGFLVLICDVSAEYMYVMPYKKASGPVKTIFIQTANDADCTLIFQNDAAVMIDAGEAQDAEHILDVLRENNIQHLDYLILSHGDQDHIGAVKDILASVEIECVVEPYCSGKDDFNELNAVLDDSDIRILYPVHNMRIRAGQIKMTIYPALEKKYTDSNNYSLGTKVTHGKVNMVFTGDALKKRSLELERIHWPEVAVYKVPHHGRANKETENLMTLVNPDYAVVTSSACDTSVRESAEKVGAELLFTSDGDLVFTSDGKSVIVE